MFSSWRRLEQEGLKPSPEADRATLIRRVGLDLTGLPPTLAEVDAFESRQLPGAYEELVDRLLASAHHGEHMAMDWLDAARYADTNGYQNDFARTMWPWRDWVIDAFNRNLPFDRFLIEQIAGDLLPAATRRRRSQRVSTGTTAPSRRLESIDEEWRIENAVDRVETTATVFLGLTLGWRGVMTTSTIQSRRRNSTSSWLSSTVPATRGSIPSSAATCRRWQPFPTCPRGRSLRGWMPRLLGPPRRARRQRATLPARQKRWEHDRQAAAEPSESRDWALRCLLDGSLTFQGPAGETIEGRFQGQNMPVWCDGPHGKAIRLDGQARSYIEVEQGVNLDRTDRFSYGDMGPALRRRCVPEQDGRSRRLSRL